jgi:hypothetical protein
MTSQGAANLERSLHEEAASAAGFDDFGDDYYREGLGRMLSDLERATGGGEPFRNLAHFLAYDALVSRLYSEEGWHRRPETRSSAIVSPVVIAGIPRTGTTMIHKFLSMNDEFQVLQNWLISYPMVRPPRETWTDNPEYRKAVAAVDAQPEMRHTTHFVGADEADECLMLVNQTFVSVMFGSAATLADYDKWMLAEDKTPSLRRHADNLRLIGGDEPQRRWLIKNPSYVLAMRELFTVYPDAKIVWTHRHPQEAMGSLVEMESAYTGSDPKERAGRELPMWAGGTRQTQEVRTDHEDAFFDVEYRALMADPVGVAAALLTWLGMDMTPETEARMHSWLEENPQGKHGTHRYDPANLGVTDEAIHSHFGSYMARYGYG